MSKCNHGNHLVAIGVFAEYDSDSLFIRKKKSIVLMQCEKCKEVMRG